MIKRSGIINFSVTALALSLAAGLATGVATGAGAQTAELDGLFEQLLQADPEEAGRLEGQIVTAWSKSGSPAMDLLLRRGQDALEAGDTDAALDHFSAAVDHDPGFAEAYNGRATALYLTGRVGPALADIRTALELNPRHFGAMRGLAVVLEEVGKPEEALEVYRRISALNPQAEGVKDAIARLEIALEGQTL